jgi:hypothetical protein
VDPGRIEHPGDESGFAGEFSTDNQGMVLVPWNKPFIEFSNGSLSFADAGIPRKRRSKDL